MTPTKMLSEEHQNILKITSALIKECDTLESGRALDKNFFEKAIGFIRNYADKFHHAKEEDILFAEINKGNANMHCNPTQQMLYEHEQGREYVKGIEDGLKNNNVKKVIENARGYASLLQEHIWKEDNILYPMVNQALPSAIQESILQEFKKAESKRFKKGIKEKYLKLAKEFEARSR